MTLPAVRSGGDPRSYYQVTPPQPPQARIAALAGVIGCAIDAQEIAAFVAHVPKSRGQDHGTPAALNGAPDQPLVLAAAVHVCCVEQVHPETDRAVDHGDGFRLIAGAVEFRHPHAPEPERRNSSVPGVIPCYPAANVIPCYPADDVIPCYPATDVIPCYPATDVIPCYPVARCTQLFRRLRPDFSSTWET
jgi:hypothetical protein